MSLVRIKNSDIHKAASTLGWLFVQKFEDGYFTVFLGRIEKRELTRAGISYREDVPIIIPPKAAP
jgi:hypothetical protein